VKKSDRARLITTRLAELYPNPPIPLDHHDPFTLLVAVVLSAQCTDKKVNEVTPPLFRRGGTPQKMAKLPVDEILSIIRPLGLAPQKAKALAGLSEMIVRDFGGEVPGNFESLESLPGVGHKTASVVMSQVFGLPAFPVDTHIHRLAQRWGLSDGSSVAQTERDLKRLFAPASWRDLHLQIIYYGREHCSARGCDGTRCPICRELFPTRKKPVIHRKA
jgi:endonuclease-3